MGQNPAFIWVPERFRADYFLSLKASYGDQLLFLQSGEAGSPAVDLGTLQEPSSCPEVTTGIQR